MNGLIWGSIIDINRRWIATLSGFIVSVGIYAVLLQMIGFVELRILVAIAAVSLNEAYKSVADDSYASSLELIYATPQGVKQHHNCVVGKWVVNSFLSSVAVILVFLVFEIEFIRLKTPLSVLSIVLYGCLTIATTKVLIKCCYLWNRIQKMVSLIVMFVLLIALGYLVLAVDWYFSASLYSLLLVGVIMLPRVLIDQDRYIENAVIRSIR